MRLEAVWQISPLSPFTFVLIVTAAGAYGEPKTVVSRIGAKQTAAFAISTLEVWMISEERKCLNTGIIDEVDISYDSGFTYPLRVSRPTRWIPGGVHEEPCHRTLWPSVHGKRK